MQTRRQFVVRGTKLIAVGGAATAAGPTILVRDAKARGNLRVNGASLPSPGLRTFRPLGDRRSPFPPDIVKQ